MIIRITKLIENGKVGQIDYFNFWEWLNGKLTEITINNSIDFLANSVMAFPFIAVVSASVYALLNMVSKGAAKLGALATILYGLFVIN